MSKTKAKVRKQTHIPKKPIYVYVSYESKCIDVLEDTLGDDGPYSGFREDDWSYEVLDVYAEPPVGVTTDWEQAKLVGSYKVPERVWLVVVRYSTGDTFSHSSGQGAIANAYVDESRAWKDARLIEDGKWPEYAAWTGYFESVESVMVIEKVML
jgi:hypothetical protein